MCCSPWGHKELDTTEWLNWTELCRSDKYVNWFDCSDYFTVYTCIKTTSTPWIGFPGGSDGKNPNLPAMHETWVRPLGWEDPLEEGMATHSSILAWRIPWTEEPGGLQSMGWQRVRQDWETRHRHTLNIYVKNISAKLLIKTLPNQLHSVFLNCRSLSSLLLLL